MSLNADRAALFHCICCRQGVAHTALVLPVPVRKPLWCASAPPLPYAYGCGACNREMDVGNLIRGAPGKVIGIVGCVFPHALTAVPP